METRRAVEERELLRSIERGEPAGDDVPALVAIVGLEGEEPMTMGIDDEVIDLVGRGQGVFGIAVGKVLREVETSLVELNVQASDAMDELALRRAAKKIS